MEFCTRLKYDKQLKLSQGQPTSPGLKVKFYTITFPILSCPSFLGLKAFRSNQREGVLQSEVS